LGLAIPCCVLADTASGWRGVRNAGTVRWHRLVCVIDPAIPSAIHVVALNPMRNGEARHRARRRRSVRWLWMARALRLTVTCAPEFSRACHSG
jgi:hypothetical protein